MSELIQTSKGNPATPPARIDIGLSPLAVWLLLLLAAGPGLALLGFLLVSITGLFGEVVVVIGMLPWTIAMMVIGIKCLVLLMMGGDLEYRRTKRAIREGRIGISYYLRGGDSVIVVDEASRLICANGHLFGFDDVKKLEWQSGNDKHRLDFVLNSGPTPVRSAELGYERNLKIAFERLSNTLGFN